MRTTLLAGTLLRDLPVGAAALVVAIMASLVYLGDHWATEVLGGLCLGWACVELARGAAVRLGLR
jgi:membrane-associated phospholipid phosphatase